MSKCLTCGEPIEQKKGKRTRIYCSDLCRVRHFQRNGKQSIKKTDGAKKPQTTTTNPNEAILKEIAAVRAELLPSHRNTILGRKAWAVDQQERIVQLQSKLT